MPLIEYEGTDINWNELPSDAAYWDDEIGGFLGITFRPPKPMRKILSKSASKAAGRRVTVNSVTVKPKHVLKSAVGIAAIASTAGAGAALTVPSGAGAAGMLASDKLLAAAEKGGKIAAGAKNIYERTKALAAAGDPKAAQALGMLDYVRQLRAKAGIAKGQPLAPGKLAPELVKRVTTKVDPWKGKKVQRRERVRVKPKAPAPGAAQTGYFVTLEGRIRRGRFRKA